MRTRAAILGKPVAHSLSPVLHGAAYRALGLTDWTYERVELDADELTGFVSALGPEWAGLSVTMPGKRAALDFATAATPRAIAAGAANTLVRKESGWFADCTDIDGIIGALHFAGGFALPGRVTGGAMGSGSPEEGGGTAAGEVAQAGGTAAGGSPEVTRRDGSTAPPGASRPVHGGAAQAVGATGPGGAAGTAGGSTDAAPGGAAPPGAIHGGGTAAGGSAGPVPGGAAQLGAGHGGGGTAAGTSAGVAPGGAAQRGAGHGGGGTGAGGPTEALSRGMGAGGSAEVVLGSGAAPAGLAKASPGGGTGSDGATGVILGGGGTAAAAVVAFGGLGVTRARLVVRDAARAKETVAAAGRAGVEIEVLTWAGVDFAKLAAEAAVLVSTVPPAAVASVAGDLAAARCVLDVIYHPWPTPLAEAVAARGGRVATGLDMLLHQAFGQVEQFTGLPAPREAMRDALRAATDNVLPLPVS